MGTLGSDPNYGTVDDFMLLPIKVPSGRYAHNILAILACLSIPCGIFALVFSLQSFSARHSNPSGSNFICLLMFGVVFFFFFLAYYTMTRKNDRLQQAVWYSVLCILSFTGLIASWLLGDLNYDANMKPFYALELLNNYPAVDPSTYSGIQLMDAGTMTFTDGSRVDTSRSMAFKDFNTYCVAPVVGSIPQNGSSYDIWAVGVNCCSSQHMDFRCGENFRRHTASGLRVVNDGLKSFFRLAVQQAEASYNIQARHPVFVYWVRDAQAEVSAYQDDAHKYFGLSLFCFFLLNLLLVILATVLISKMQ